MKALRKLSLPLAILWCYAIWYLVMLGFYFEPDAMLWATSLGIAFIVGIALTLSTGPLSWQRWQEQRWSMLRLFIIPFCVSSFSALAKDRDFFLIFSPQLEENLLALGLCCFLLLFRHCSQRGSHTTHDSHNSSD